MGLPELWELLGDGDIVETAQLATEHYHKTGRPLRIAVDEAGWRFNNLNEHQVKAIREKSGEQAFQGIEKQMFWRIARLLKQNIQLLFVFDGSRRPWKNGKTAGRIDYKSRELTEQLLDVLRISHYRAPAEAEAECVRLQQLGVVDAVWSEDADALMFGCDFLIRDYREPKKKREKTNRSKTGTKKSNTHVRVIRLKHLQALQLSREDIVLFAVVCGGDYDREGLRNCGRNTAMKMIKHGLARTLYACKSETDLGDWRHALIQFLAKAKATSNVIVRNDYPKLKHVKNYRDPLVSTNDAIANLECLRHGWDRSLDEEALREFISTRFNLWTKGYFNWIGPILLTRFLSMSTARSNPHAVRLTKRRAPKPSETGEDEVLPSFESKLSFSPFDLSSLGQDRFHDRYWTGKREDEFEADHRVECEILDCMLRRALPDEVLNLPAKTPAKKRKRATDAQEGEDGIEAQPHVSPKKRKSKATKKAAEEDSRIPPTNEPTSSSLLEHRPQFRIPTDTVSPFAIPSTSASSNHLPVVTAAARSATTDVIDLLDSEDSESEDEQLREAIRLSLQEQRKQPTPRNPTFHNNPRRKHEPPSSSISSHRSPSIHTIKSKYAGKANAQISPEPPSSPSLFVSPHSPGVISNRLALIAGSPQESILPSRGLTAVKDEIRSGTSWSFDIADVNKTPQARSSAASRADVLKAIQGLPSVAAARARLSQPKPSPAKPRDSRPTFDTFHSTHESISTTSNGRLPSTQAFVNTFAAPQERQESSLTSMEDLKILFQQMVDQSSPIAARTPVPAAEVDPEKNAERIRAARLARFGNSVSATEKPHTSAQALVPEIAVMTTDAFQELPDLPVTTKRRARKAEPEIETIDLTSD